MDEQEAVLTRYFRPDQVKRLMKEQQEVDDSYAVLRVSWFFGGVVVVAARLGGGEWQRQGFFSGTAESSPPYNGTRKQPTFTCRVCHTHFRLSCPHHPPCLPPASLRLPPAFPPCRGVLLAWVCLTTSCRRSCASCLAALPGANSFPSGLHRLGP